MHWSLSMRNISIECLNLTIAVNTCCVGYNNTTDNKITRLLGINPQFLQSFGDAVARTAPQMHFLDDSAFSDNPSTPQSFVTLLRCSQSFQQFALLITQQMILQSLFLLEVLVRLWGIRRNPINQVVLRRHLVENITKSTSLY